MSNENQHLVHEQQFLRLFKNTLLFPDFDAVSHVDPEQIEHPLGLGLELIDTNTAVQDVLNPKETIEEPEEIIFAHCVELLLHSLGRSMVQLFNVLLASFLQQVYKVFPS